MFGSKERATANGGAKSSGMEMMVGTILKGFGVTPEVLNGHIETGKDLATQFVTAMQTMNERLDRIEQTQSALLSACNQNAMVTAQFVAALKGLQNGDGDGNHS